MPVQQSVCLSDGILWQGIYVVWFIQKYVQSCCKLTKKLLYKSFILCEKQIFCLYQVARDKAVKRWIFNEGIEMEDNDYGSGYPGGEWIHII